MSPCFCHAQISAGIRTASVIKGMKLLLSLSLPGLVNQTLFSVGHFSPIDKHPTEKGLVH